MRSNRQPRFLGIVVKNLSAVRLIVQVAQSSGLGFGRIWVAQADARVLGQAFVHFEALFIRGSVRKDPVAIGAKEQASAIAARLSPGLAAVRARVSTRYSSSMV
jgi:hypothetical protein